MAVEQGTATNFVDFYNKLRDFLTTDTDLVTASQEWTQIAGNMGTLIIDDTITLQGPGLAGTDEIRVKLRPVYSVVDGRYNLELVGVPNWNPLVDQSAQFNMSTPVYIHLWNSTMPYTFVANGRRFVAIAQVSSVVEACYGGFMLPYALPAEYPYPLVIGGSSNQSTWSFSQTNLAHCHFVNPSDSMYVYGPSNTWINFRNFTVSSGNYSWQTAGSLVLPYNAATNSSQFRTVWGSLKECFGSPGPYPLHALILITNTPTTARFGVLDGCYHIPGLGNSHGSLIDVDAPDDHMVVQNVTRVDNWLGYWAIKLG